MSALTLIFLLACGGEPEAPSAEPPAEVPVPEHAADNEPERITPPFSPDQIREAMPVGTKVALSMAAKGQAPSVDRWQVVQADAEAVTIRYSTDGSDEPPEDKRSTWAELSQHAAFPKAQTTRSAESITTPLGSFDAIRFDVTADTPGGKVEQVYFFAPELPGPPVRMVVWQKGVETLRMDIIEREVGP